MAVRCGRDAVPPLKRAPATGINQESPGRQLVRQNSISLIIRFNHWVHSRGEKFTQVRQEAASASSALWSYSERVRKYYSPVADSSRTYLLEEHGTHLIGSPAIGLSHCFPPLTRCFPHPNAASPNRSLLPPPASCFPYPLAASPTRSLLPPPARCFPHPLAASPTGPQLKMKWLFTRCPI